MEAAINFGGKLIVLKVLRCHSGFTLIEIAAVLVIIAILSTLAVKHMGSSGISLYGEADRLVADLRYAQTIAMTRAPDAPDDEDYVKVVTTTDGWVLPYNKREDIKDKDKLRFADGNREEGKVREKRTTITADVSIRFEYPKGTVDLGGPDHQDIKLTQGSKSITIRVYDETGYVEIQ